MDDGCTHNNQLSIIHDNVIHTISDGLVFIRMILVDTAIRMVSCKHKVHKRWQMYAGMVHVLYVVLGITIALDSWWNESSVLLYNLLFPICSECGYIIPSIASYMFRRGITSTTYYTRYESISSLLITCINCTRSENSHIMVYRYVYPTTGISFVWGWCHVFAFGVACCL